MLLQGFHHRGHGGARRRTEERRLGQLRTYGLPFFFFSLYILCWWISLSAETPRFGPF